MKILNDHRGEINGRVELTKEDIQVILSALMQDAITGNFREVETLLSQFECLSRAETLS